jgi:hypothetical protein
VRHDNGRVLNQLPHSVSVSGVGGVP